LIVYAEIGTLMNLGIEGETLAHIARFNITKWITTYGDDPNARISLFVKQNDLTYPVNITRTTISD